jgi:hypothetical protein
MTAVRTSARTQVLLWAAVLFAFGGCGEPVPVVALDSRVCTPRIELATARPVNFDDQVGVDINEQSPCLVENGRKRVFVLFRLPDTSESYSIFVTSEPIGRVLFVPHVQTLDATGQVMREVSRESFMLKGMSISAGLRSRPGERYVLVRSDGDAAGEQVARFAQGRDLAAVVPAGAGTWVFFKGTEETKTYTFAHNGKIVLAVRPIPKAN